MIILLANALCAHDSIRSFSWFPPVENFPHHAAECGGAVWLLQVTRVSCCRRCVFRFLRITASKKNRQALEQSRELRRHRGPAYFGHDHVKDREGWRFFLT